MSDLSGHTELALAREELAELTSATLALVQWYADTGTVGLPVEGSVEAALEAIMAAPQGGRPASAERLPAYPSALTVDAPPWAAPTAPAGVLPDRTHTAALPSSARPAASAQPPFGRAQAAAASSAFASAAFQAPRAAGAASGALPAEPRGPSAARPVTPHSPAPATTEDAASAVPADSVQAPPASPDERRARLALLAEEARACTQCSLHEQRKQAVFARGNPFAELCFVGEGPGADEDALGEPFVGAAGQLLDKMIGAMGYRRDDVYICNIVKCRPPKNRKPEPDEMAACSPFLTAQLDLIRPKVIVALGGTAVQGLIGSTEGITRLRGKWKLYKGMTPIMPTFHPAYLLRNAGAKREVWADLQEVMRHLGKPSAAKE